MSTSATTTASHSGDWTERTPWEIDGHSDRSGDWRVYEPLRLPPVLRHALEAFAEHGYHGTSVRDIAKRLGQTVPAIYYHYENKQALLVTLLQGSIGEVLERCQLAVLEAGHDPVTRLRFLVRCVTLYIANRREFAVLGSEMRSLEPENRRRYVARRDELEGLVVGAISDGRQHGLFRTAYPTDAARAVLAMCLRIAEWYRPDGRLTPEEVADRYVEFALGVVRYDGANPPG